MGKEIKVEGYARTKTGEIYIVLGKYERGQFGEICVQLADFKTKEPQGEEWERHLKMSENIIDLIEMGDYVNGERVEEVFRDGIVYYDKLRIHTTENNDYFEEDIKSIVTKENFASMQYKLEAEDK